MTVYGSSAQYRNGLTGNEEWVRIDNVIAGLNGGYHMKARRSYGQSIPTSYTNSEVKWDIGKRISAYSLRPPDTELNNTGWYKTINGGHDAAIRSFVNSVPSGHKMYLIYNHEPENDGGNPAELWRQAWARFAKVVLDCGNSNIIPTFNLMAYTWDARNPWDYNPARHMTADEVAACVGTVDAYTRPPDALFDEPYADILDWGFRGFGVMEMGQESAAATPQWMLDVEDWVDAHTAKTEIVCWWHASTDKNYLLDQNGTIMATWADIIGRNQGASIPVSTNPDVDIPASSGTGNSTGTPVVGTGNVGGYSIAGVGSVGPWSRITFTQAEGWPSAATSEVGWQGDFGPVVMPWSDNSATVAWEGDPYVDLFTYPELAEYHKVWKRDYQYGSYLTQPPSSVIANYAWDATSSPNVLNDRAWWVANYSDEPYSFFGRMYVYDKTTGLVGDFESPTQVGDYQSRNVYPIGDNEAIFIGLYREPLTSGWARMAAWHVTLPSTYTFLGSYIFGYEYTSGFPPYVDYSMYGPVYSTELDRGIWIHEKGDESDPHKKRYVLFTTNGGTNFQVISAGSCNTAFGYQALGYYHWLRDPCFNSAGNVLLQCFDTNVNGTRYLAEIDITGSAPTLVNSAVIPEGFDLLTTQQFNTPAGASLVGTSSTPSYSWNLWPGVFSGTAPVQISPPDTVFDQQDSVRFRVKYPWILSNFVYEESLGYEFAPPPAYWQNSAWLSVVGGTLPDLDGELTEKRQKFARSPTDYTA